MSSNLHWDEFAEALVRRMLRPHKGDAFLILADTATDPGLAQACLAAGLRAGADTQLMIYKRIAWGEAAYFGPIVLDAIRASRLILGFHSNFLRTDAAREALAKGTRILSTEPWDMEEFLISGFLDVDYEAMIQNGEVVAKLWDATKECVVVSEEGTDIRFELAPRKSTVSDGMLTEDGELDFFPGVQVTVAPIEETINGKIVVDTADDVQGILRKPYTLQIEDGIITAVEGGLEAVKLRRWMETRNDETIYRLCHFTIGLNPKAQITPNLMEGERILGCVDFGFGSQPQRLGGTVGLSPYHMDVLVTSPTVYLDGKVMSEKNTLNPELGFVEV
jgi:leucyl aminopeptidase (aminopeptidase T)